MTREYERKIRDEFMEMCDKAEHCYNCPLCVHGKVNVCEGVFFYNKAIDEFQEWLKTQIVGIDNKTKEILVVVDDKWELAIDKFKGGRENA